MNDDAADRLRAEFKQLGVDRVRNELVLRRWTAEKLSAARQWVEREDARQWQQARGDAPTQLRNNQASKRKWLGYAVAAVSLLYAAVRLFRTFKAG